MIANLDKTHDDSFQSAPFIHIFGPSPKSPTKQSSEGEEDDCRPQKGCSRREEKASRKTICKPADVELNRQTSFRESYPFSSVSVVCPMSGGNETRTGRSQFQDTAL